jgi:hypothetical protein
MKEQRSSAWVNTEEAARVSRLLGERPPEGQLLTVSGCPYGLRVFRDYLEVHSQNGSIELLDYEDVAKVTVEQPSGPAILFRQLVIKLRSGREISLTSKIASSASQARVTIYAQRKDIRRLRKVGFRSLEDLDWRPGPLPWPRASCAA